MTRIAITFAAWATTLLTRVFPMEAIGRMLLWVSRLQRGAIREYTAYIARAFVERRVEGRLVYRVSRSKMHWKAKVRQLRTLWGIGDLESKRKKRRLAERVTSRINSLVISVTGRCNLRCEGCFAELEDVPPKEMTIEEFDALLRQGEDLGIFIYVLIGGEPLLKDGLFEVIAKHPESTYLIFTNGTLLTRDLVDLIGSLGNVFPILSIDGSAEDTDMRRGEGVFSRVMSAQKLLDDHKILHGISIVVSERNQDYVGTEGFVDRIKSDTSILLWYFDFVDVCSSSSVDYGVAPGWDFYEEVKGIQAKKDVFVLYFPYDEFVLDNGCIGAGRRYLHINWNGDVEACFFKHERIDNIRDNDLAEIVRSQVIADVRASTRSRGCDNQACRHLWEYPTGHRVEA